MSVAEETVPAPHPPRPTAAEFLNQIRHRNGRIIRFREALVTVLTNDPETAAWLVGCGGKAFLPRNLPPAMVGPYGSYRRAPGGPPEWDIYIHHIPVSGEQTIWEAAAPEVTLDPEQLA